MDAAKHWAGGGGDQDLEEDLAEWGVPESEIERQREENAFVVWPDNWDTLILFLASSSQWSYGPSGMPVGLRYEGVESVARLARIEITPERFWDLRLMESAAREVFADTVERHTDEQSRRK